MSNFFRINLFRRTTESDLFGGGFKDFLISYPENWEYVSNGLVSPPKKGCCLRKKTKDEAAVLAGLPTPPMRRNDGKRWENTLLSQ